MTVKVMKLIVVVDADTADQIEELASLSNQSRDARIDEFTFDDKNGVSHELHFVHAEVV